MSIETLELIVKLIFPIGVIIMIRGVVNMGLFKTGKRDHDDLMTGLGLIFFSFVSLFAFYYPTCIKFNEFNTASFLVFLGSYTLGRLLYNTY